VKTAGYGVVIHEVDTLRSVPAMVIDSDQDGDTGDVGTLWIPGKTFGDPAGVQVCVKDYTATGFVVTIGLGMPSACFTPSTYPYNIYLPLTQ
jgi:hypothetical protein